MTETVRLKDHKAWTKLKNAYVRALARVEQTSEALDAFEAENYRADWFKSNTGRDCIRARLATA